MTKLTVDKLVESFGSANETAARFHVTLAAILKWRTHGIPEYVALLCYLLPDVQYTFQLQDYGREDLPLLLEPKKAS